MKLIEKTINQVFKKRVIETPDKIFIRYEGHAYTYKMVDTITTNFAKIMMKEGVQKGDSVGLTGINTDNFIFLFLSIEKIGAKAVLINSYYKVKELKECIKIANIKYLFFADIKDHRVELKTKLEEDSERLGVRVYTAYSDYGTWMSYNYESEEIDVEIDVFSTAVVLFTSGTTSTCKGVILSHYSLINNAREIVYKMRWKAKDVLCLTVPLFHCFGISVSFLCSIIAGMEIVILDKFRTVNVCKAIEKYRCNVLNGVPSMFLAMIKNKESKNFDMNSLESGIIAGSPVSQKEYLSICKYLNMKKLQRSYGLTEASPCVTISDYDDSLLKKSNTEGKVIDNVEVSIIDIETKKECNIGQWGELIVRGYNVSKGYLGCEKNNSSIISKEGLKTGDLGYFDEAGCLYIVGRIKNLIIRGGENISPIEIAKVINNFDSSLRVQILGVESDVLQEEIVAFFEGKRDLEKEEKLKEYLEDNLSKYKNPAYFFYIDKFPKLATGKVDERKLKEISKANIKRMANKRI